MISEINDGQHKYLLEYLLNKIIDKSYSTPSANKKHIIKWLEASQSRQLYVLMKKDKLQVYFTCSRYYYANFIT